MIHARNEAEAKAGLEEIIIEMLKEIATEAVEMAVAEEDAAQGEALKPDISRAVARQDLQAVLDLMNNAASSPAVQSLGCGGVRAIIEALVTPEEALRKRRKADDGRAEKIRKEFGLEPSIPLYLGLTSTVRTQARAVATTAGRDPCAEEIAAVSRFAGEFAAYQHGLAVEEAKEATLKKTFIKVSGYTARAVNAVCAAMSKFPEEEAAAAGAWALRGVVEKMAPTPSAAGRVPWKSITQHLLSVLQGPSTQEAKWRAMAACQSVARHKDGAEQLHEVACGVPVIADAMLGWWPGANFPQTLLPNWFVHLPGLVLVPASSTVERWEDA